MFFPPRDDYLRWQTYDCSYRAMIMAVGVALYGTGHYDSLQVTQSKALITRFTFVSRTPIKCMEVRKECFISDIELLWGSAPGLVVIPFLS